MLVLKLRKRKQNVGKAPTDVSEHVQSEKQQTGVNAYETSPTELLAESAPVELDGREPAELSGHASVRVRTAA